MWGEAGMGRGGSEKCKPIPTPPRGVGLKSRPISAPPPLRGGENPHGAKRGGAGQAGRGKIAIPTCKSLCYVCEYVFNFSIFILHKPIMIKHFYTISKSQ